MSRETIIKSLDELKEVDEDLLLADGFEDAFIGVASQFNKKFVCYDYDKCIRILMKRDGMTEEEAEEFMQFNVVGAYVGEHTPAFLERIKVKKNNKEE